MNQVLQEQPENEWLKENLWEGKASYLALEQTLCNQLTEARAFTQRLQEQNGMLQEGFKEERVRNLASEQALRERITALGL